MNRKENKLIRIAILDLYEGEENQGMRCIRAIINQWSQANNLAVAYDEFDVRRKLEVPDLSYDVFISTGGPGSPLDTEGSEWETKYFHWLQQVEKWNNNVANEVKKHVYLICHSFQLVSRHYQLGNVCKRRSTSFGVFPIHMLQEGKKEIIFEGLGDPFYSVDSRDYQLIEPNHNRIKQMGAKILAIEKERPYVPYERAVMAIRFNDYMMGTQFHPEADTIGMSMYLQREDKRKYVTETYGEDKWKSMVDQLLDPDKIMFTYNHILPNFLNHAIG